MPRKSNTAIVVGNTRLTLEGVIALATGVRKVRLPESRSYQARITRGADLLRQALESGECVYGVNTGYGDNCTTEIPEHLVAGLPDNLIRYHGVGSGVPLDPEETRAVLACRLNSLALGFSGVRPELLRLLVGMLNQGVLPRIPSEGSVGASGDLTPLSYVAAVMTGRRRASYRGKMMTAAAALRAAKLMPITLAPKEGLALMNGTAVMTGLACLAYARAEHLVRAATRITAMISYATDGNPAHFDRRLFAVKPHAGQQAVAAWLRADLGALRGQRVGRLQDRYSLRCAPHVIGVLADALTWVRRDLENEINSANDNPLIDPTDGHIMHGGHFYGGHVGFAMDALKLAVASVADLIDRQMALLVDARYSHGLPANLAPTEGRAGALRHGFKAVQISCSAWTAEALKLTMPATAFSRSTECHNQDKVSMGTIAARDCLRILELTEQVTAAALLAASQGVVLRMGMAGASAPNAPLLATVRSVESAHGRQGDDRELDGVIEACVARLRAQSVPVSG
jgi:histidine ammonia-lyase